MDRRRTCASVSEESGIVVAVENMFPLRLPGAPSMRFHSEHARADREETPYLVLDTSHAAVAGQDIRQALARDRDRIRHIHLSNNAGRGWDSHLPVGRDGVLPIEAFLADLTDGYRGAVSLELDLRPWMKDPTRAPRPARAAARVLRTPSEQRRPRARAPSAGADARCAGGR